MGERIRLLRRRIIPVEGKHAGVHSRFVLAAIWLIVAAVLSYSQSIPAPLQRYMAQSRINTPGNAKVDDLVKKYEKYQRSRAQDDPLHRNRDIPFKPEFTGDEPNSEDQSEREPQSSTDQQMSTEKLSVYEKMIRGEVVNPDESLSKLEVFGHEVFEDASGSMVPNDHVSVPSSYPIGSGDEMVIMLWGRINEEYRLSVDRDGKINVPRLGPISVRGLPFSVAQKNIVDRVESIEGVQASVTMGELRSIQIYVVGEVKAPGMYTVSALTNITNALFAAGGPKPDGALRNIQLKRNGRVVATVDFYDFLLKGENKTNVRLRPGDVVFVPIASGMAAVAGNVRRSAFYELKNKTTLPKLLELAGGITPAAWVNRIQIERFEKNQFQVVLDFTADSAESLPDVTIQDGDIVKIFPVVLRDQNAVFLSGNVLRPGKYEYTENMTVADLIPSFNDLLPETYYQYAIIRRQPPPHFRESLVPFNLSRAMEDRNSVDNLPLEPLDEIMVYHRDYFEPDRTVSIGGAVTQDTTHSLLENMTIRDLIIKAGGLRDDASPTRGELYRRKMDGDYVSTERVSFCVECAMDDDPGHNLVLQKMDRVYVRQKKGWEEEKRVELRGEFVFPGSYVLLEGETLGELIERAGGFTDDAYLAAAVFTRESVKAFERKRMREYVQRLESDLMKISSELASKEKTEEAQAIALQQSMVKEKLEDADPVGRVVIDLQHEEGYRQFVLEDGDHIYVPKKMNTVSVFGEVFNPATFTLDENYRRVSHYVQMSGGYKEHANRKQVYVIKANGSVRTKRMVNVDSYQLEPGDAVVVPQKIKYTSGFKIFMDTINAVVQLTTVVALVTATISAFEKTGN